jgi:hypothetical protein
MVKRTSESSCKMTASSPKRPDEERALATTQVCRSLPGSQPTARERRSIVLSPSSTRGTDNPPIAQGTHLVETGRKQADCKSRAGRKLRELADHTRALPRESECLAAVAIFAEFRHDEFRQIGARHLLLADAPLRIGQPMPGRRSPKASSRWVRGRSCTNTQTGPRIGGRPRLSNKWKNAERYAPPRVRARLGAFFVRMQLR